MGIPMPPAPWSPRPRMRSLSVATIRRTSRSLRVAEQLRDPVHVVGSDPQAAGAAHHVTELPAGVADRWRVDDRGELLEVIGEHPVEQRLVAVLQCGESDVLLEVVGLALQVLELERHLLGEADDAVRHQPAQPERVAFRIGVGGVPVVRGAGHQRRAPGGVRASGLASPQRPRRSRGGQRRVFRRHRSCHTFAQGEVTQTASRAEAPVSRADRPVTRSRSARRAPPKSTRPPLPG